MMDTKEGFPTLLVKHTGKFNLKSLYKNGINWFSKYKYDFTEKEHTVKDNADGQQNIFTWVGEREINDFLLFRITVKFWMDKVIKTKDGQNEGYIIVRFSPEVEFDYKKQWQGSSFSRFLLFIYVNYVIKKEIKNLWDVKLYIEQLELINLIKKELGLIH